MPGYSEDELIEQPAIELFGELGWETANWFHEFEQAGGSPLGRDGLGGRPGPAYVGGGGPALGQLQPRAPGFFSPILGLMFPCHADHKFTQAQAALAKKAGASQGRWRISKIDYHAEGVLYLPESARFSNQRKLPEGEHLGKAVNGASKAWVNEAAEGKSRWTRGV